METQSGAMLAATVIVATPGISIPVVSGRAVATLPGSVGRAGQQRDHETVREERRLKKYPRDLFPAGMGSDAFGLGGFENKSAKRGGRARKKNRSKAGPRDRQGYLFDDLFDEEEDIDIEEGYEDEDDGPDHPSLDPSIVPPELLELMGEVQASNRGKKNLTFSEFMRIVAKHPGLGKALIDIMNKAPVGRTR